jgi:hypothetical protein
MTDDTAIPPASPAVPAAAEDEFAGIEPPRRMRSPVVAALALLLAGYLVFHLRTDFAYCWQGTTPRALGDARAAVASAPAGNQFVTVRGMPDRSNAVLLEIRGKDDYRQLFRLLGTDSRVLVLRGYGQVPTSRALHDEFTGRWIDLHELPWADSIREWFRARTSATHLFDPGALRLHLPLRAPLELTDLAGDRVRLTPESRLALDFVYTDQYRLLVPRDQPGGADGARDALAKAGFAGPKPAALPVELPSGNDFYLFYGRPRAEMRDSVERVLQNTDPRIAVRPDPADPAELYVALPKALYHEGFEQAQRALENLGLVDAAAPPYVFMAGLAAKDRDAVLGKLDRRIGVSLRAETQERAAGQIDPGKPDLPLERLTRAKLIEPLTIPADAHVLVEADAPSSYWYVPVIDVMLVLFGVFNLFALREALRGRWRSASSTP